MLEAVLAAAVSVGRTWVVSPDPVDGAIWIPDPGGGQGTAVEAALREIGPGPALIVNSDLPSVTADDLRALHDAIPERGIAIAPARDGTTNALGLSSTTFFAPLYGPGSAARFRSGGACRAGRRGGPPRPEGGRGHARRPGEDVKVVVLSGGVGGARFVQGLVEAVEPSDVTVIGNVGDDVEVLGLHVSPDLDSILYALAGLNDEERGWGRADETWRALETVGAARRRDLVPAR